MGHAHTWEIRRLGLLRYAEALALQEHCREEVAAGHPGFWLIVRHPPVVTAGRRSSALGDLDVSPAELQGRGIDFAQTTRGGLLTYHHPGQVVVYPILDLRRLRMAVREYVEYLAGIVCETVAGMGIGGRYRPEAPGVWVYNRGVSRKIASIGVNVNRGITLHGVALNVRPDARVAPFMRCCGMPAEAFASIEEELGRSVEPEEVEGLFVPVIECVDPRRVGRL